MTYRELDRYLTDLGLPIVGPRRGQAERNCNSGGSTSYHCTNRGALARDWGHSDYGHDGLADIAEALAPFAVGPRAAVRELFYAHPRGREWFFKDGDQISPSEFLRETHRDHVHAALWANRTLPHPVKRAWLTDFVDRTYKRHKATIETDEAKVEARVRDLVERMANGSLHPAAVVHNARIRGRTNPER
jgi:hypothetical protein